MCQIKKWPFYSCNGLFDNSEYSLIIFLHETEWKSTLNFACNLKGNIDNIVNMPNFRTFICFTVNWSDYNDWIISSQLKDNKYLSGFKCWKTVSLKRYHPRRSGHSTSTSRDTHKNVPWNLNIKMYQLKKIAGFFCAPVSRINICL